MEVYPESALSAAESGKVEFSHDHLQTMLTQNAEVPGYITPDLEECVLELQNQRPGLVALESDYFDLVSGGIKEPETVPDWHEWCYNVFKLYKECRERGRKLGIFGNWITKATIDDVEEGSGIIDVCRSERDFLVERWSAADTKIEKLFYYAMLHGIPEDDLKIKQKEYRRNIPIFKDNLQQLKIEPGKLQSSPSWIDTLEEMRAEIMASHGISPRQISQPLDLGQRFNDSARLRVFGHFLCQDITIILDELEAIIETYVNAYVDESWTTFEQWQMDQYRY